jgi:hypothetical protein
MHWYLYLQILRNVRRTGWAVDISAFTYGRD